MVDQQYMAFKAWHVDHAHMYCESTMYINIYVYIPSLKLSK